MKPLSFKTNPENEIVFSYIPKKHLKSSIQLTNISDQLLAFKIKTNVPVCYLVKPHIGCIQPNSTLEISITMQPTDYNPQTAAISDKFLINIVPLPPNTDQAAMADPGRFQQIWDAAPKNQVQSHKLKVGLKFEGEGVNTSVLDKTADDSLRQMAADNRTSTLRTSMGESSFVEAREEAGRSSMTHSFSMDTTPLGINRNSTGDKGSSILEQAGLPQFGQTGAIKTDQPLKINVEVKKEEEKKSESRPAAPRSFEERIVLLERRIEESENDKRNLNQRYQEMTGKSEDQKRLLFDLSEENARLKSELGNLKNSTFKNPAARREGQTDAGGYQLWHILLALIIGLIAGAYLSS